MSNRNGKKSNKDKDLPKVEGGGGALFARQDNHRSDARLAARIISLGVVPEEKAAKILGMAFDLASDAAKKNKAREYAAAMSIPIAAAKLEIELAKPSQEGDKHVHLHLNTLSDNELETLRGIRKRIAGPDTERNGAYNGTLPPGAEPLSQ